MCFPFSLPYPSPYSMRGVKAFCGCGKLCGYGKLGVGLGNLWKEVVGLGGNPQWVPCGKLEWVRRVVRPLVFGFVVLGSVPLSPLDTSAYLFLPLCPVA